MWGARAVGEGAAHRHLRVLAALHLQAAFPGCALSVPPPRTAASRRRPDLLARAPGGVEVAVELGAADADSVHAQLREQGATHVLVLPFTGLGDRRARGYVFRGARRPPLPAPSGVELRAAWRRMLREGPRRAPGAVIGPASARAAAVAGATP